VAEYVRQITVTIEVDTNKRTERRVLTNLTFEGAKAGAVDVLDEIKERTDG